MKRILIIAAMLVGATAAAQNFGGWQMPEIKMDYSQKFADVNYAGDGEVYHNLDIYLPKIEKESYPVVIHIYGSAWYSTIPREWPISAPSATPFSTPAMQS